MERTPCTPDRRVSAADRRRGRGTTRRVCHAAARLLAIGAVLVAGCGRAPTDGATEGMTPGTFVDVMVALREAEREALATDSAEASFEERKEQVLAELGVEEEELREFVRRHHGDFALMDRLWDSIAQRLKHVPEPLPEEDGEPDGLDPALDSVPIDDGAPVLERPRPGAGGGRVMDDWIRVRTLH